MKAIKIVLLIALVAYSSLANAAAPVGQALDDVATIASYSLEELTDAAANYKAPSEIQKAMRAFVRQDLDECSEEIGLTEKQQNSYFSARKIRIGNVTDDYLVFPSTRCASFYGAHAIAYWIIGKRRNKGFTLLYSGRNDGFDVLKTTTKGLHDIRSSYGWSFTILKYNGTVYKKVSEGKFPF
jgi:hypothetical protein